MVEARGFITQASYRVVTDADGRRRPVIHVYGRLEDGAHVPGPGRSAATTLLHPRRRCERARAVGAPAAAAVRPGERSTAHRCAGSKSRCPATCRRVRDRLHAAGIETFEADVRFAVRYLIERGIKAGCTIDGEADRRQAPSPGSSTIRRCGPRTSASSRACCRSTSRRIAKASGCSRSRSMDPGIDEVLIVDDSEREMPEKATRCESEFAALDGVLRPRPVARSGRADRLEHRRFRSGGAAAHRRRACGIRSTSAAMRARCVCARPKAISAAARPRFPGRLVLDGIDLLRGAFVRMDDYSLDAVARQVLGEGKAVKGDVRDRIGEILHNYRDDLPAFALYARTDARLAYEIVQQAQSRATRVRAQPADRHDARSRRGQHRVVRFSVPERARAAAASSRPACAATTRASTPRSRAATCSSPSPVCTATSGSSTSRACIPASSAPSTSIRCRTSRRPAPRRGSHRDARWRVPPRAGDPAAAARRAVSATRSGAPGRRRGGLARHQDPDELVLRRARHARLPLLQPGARELDHRHGTRDPVVVEALVRGGRLRGAVRRHGQPVRADADERCGRRPATRRQDSRPR